MPEDALPKSLFKYTAFNSALLCIENSTLYWSSVASFNDPFEYACTFFNKGNENAVTSRYFATGVISNPSTFQIFNNDRGLVSLVGRFHKGLVTFNEVENYINNYLLSTDAPIKAGKPVKLMTIVRNIFVKQMTDYYKTPLGNKSGVLCLTDNSCEKSSRLMWSHYAENHHGVCVKLNTDRLINVSNNIKTKIRKVKYQEEMPKITYEDFLGYASQLFPEHWENLCQKMTFTKSNEWEYENEYRSLIFVNNNSRAIPVDKSTFESLYLGLRISDSNKRAILEVVKKHMPHLKVYQTELIKDKYSLTYQPIF